MVALAAAAQWIGAPGPPELALLFQLLVAAFVGWLITTGIVWGIGVKGFGHTSDFGELLRTLGFARAPLLLLFVGLIPLGPVLSLLWLAVFVLLLIAFVVAVRQALDVTTGRAVFICALAVGAEVLLSLAAGGLAA